MTDYEQLLMWMARRKDNRGRYAPAAITSFPKVYAEHYAARAAVCRGYHIGLGFRV
jgi:hypothetical protein